MRKVILFLVLDNRSRFLLLEAFFFLGWARFLKSKPFSKVVLTLGIPMEETPYRNLDFDMKVLKQISQAVQIMSRHTLWESQCLVKAIAALKMLERRKIDCTLYLGTAKDDNGKLIAHAWLRSGMVYITGYEDMGKFTEVSRFANRTAINLKGENYEKEPQS